jgi:hypothetical protein
MCIGFASLLASTNVKIKQHQNHYEILPDSFSKTLEEAIMTHEILKTLVFQEVINQCGFNLTTIVKDELPNISFDFQSSSKYAELKSILDLEVSSNGQTVLLKMQLYLDKLFWSDVENLAEQLVDDMSTMLKIIEANSNDHSNTKPASKNTFESQSIPQLDNPLLNQYQLKPNHNPDLNDNLYANPSGRKKSQKWSENELEM